MNKKSLGKKEISMIGIVVVLIGVVIWYVTKPDGAAVDSSPASVSDIEGLEASFVEVPSDEAQDIFSTDDFERLDIYFDGGYELEPRGKDDPFKPFTIQPLQNL